MLGAITVNMLGTFRLKTFLFYDIGFPILLFQLQSACNIEATQIWFKHPNFEGEEN